LTTKLAAEETRTYTVRNVDKKAKTLIIEHPLRQGYTLLNQKPAEKTASAYRFEIQLAAGATQEFPVSEERVYDQTYQVTSLTPDMILSYVSNRTLSDAGRGQLQRIADQKQQVAANDRALQEAEGQTRDLTADEERIRQNIGSLNNVSGQQQQVQNYAGSSTRTSSSSPVCATARRSCRRRNLPLETELNKLIEALAF